MGITYTEDNKRHILKLYENYRRSKCLSDIAPKLENVLVDEHTRFNLTPLECEKAFRRLIRSITGFTEKEVDKTVTPLRIISGKEYRANPYYQNIKLEYIREGNAVMTMDLFSRESLHAYGETLWDDTLTRKFQYGVFDEDAIYYWLGDERSIWRSISPAVINSMERDIERMRGRVLVLGGELGYFPYRCSLKEDVTSVTVVERNRNIVKMLRGGIIPQFGNKKVKLIEEDAFDFLNAGINGKFDTVFVEIWGSAETGKEKYRKLLKYENRNPEIQFYYWLEGDILSMLVEELFLRMIEGEKEEEWEQIWRVMRESGVKEMLKKIEEG